MIRKWLKRTLIMSLLSTPVLVLLAVIIVVMAVVIASIPRSSKSSSANTVASTSLSCNGSPASDLGVDASVLARIKQNQPIYQQAADTYWQHGEPPGEGALPWQIAAAVHYREGGNNPSQDLQAGRQIGTSGPPFSSDPAQPTLLDSVITFYKHLQANARSGLRHKPLTDVTADPDALKDALYSYNGRGYNGQAVLRGVANTPWDASPYVMNMFDSAHQNMGKITHDFGPVDGIDKQVGAFTLYSRLGGCTTTTQAQLVSAPGPQAVPSVIAQVLSFALAQRGKPYKWGAVGPDTYDCSGLIQTAYGQAGVNIQRTSQAQYASQTKVPLDQLQPGDEVYIEFPYGGPNHVGLYEGNGMMIEAPYTGAVVREVTLAYFVNGTHAEATRPLPNLAAPPASVSAAPVAPSAPDISSPSGDFVLGDSIAIGIEQAVPSAVNGWQVAFDGSTGRSMNNPGSDRNHLTGLDAVSADQNVIALATRIFVVEGTNPAGPVDLNQFAADVGQQIDSLRAVNSGASIFWLAILSTSDPQYPQRNTKIDEVGAQKGVQVIHAVNIPLGPDGTHPTSSGYATLAQLLFGQ